MAIICTYRGDWSKVPQCLSAPKTHHPPVFLPVVLTLLVVLLLIIIMIVMRNRIKLKMHDIHIGLNTKQVELDTILTDIKGTDRPLYL